MTDVFDGEGLLKEIEELAEAEPSDAPELAEALAVHLTRYLEAIASESG